MTTSYKISEEFYKAILALASETPAKLSGDIFFLLKNLNNPENNHISLIEDKEDSQTDE